MAHGLKLPFTHHLSIQELGMGSWEDDSSNRYDLSYLSALDSPL